MYQPSSIFDIPQNQLLTQLQQQFKIDVVDAFNSLNDLNEKQQEYAEVRRIHEDRKVAIAQREAALLREKEKEKTLSDSDEDGDSPSVSGD